MGVSISKVSLGGDDVSEIVQLNLTVEDNDWFGVFDQIEVQRSRGLSTGPFESVTASGWLPARIPHTGGDRPAVTVTGATVDVVGRDLLLRLNELEDATVLFTDSGPGTLTLAEVAEQIQSQLLGRVLSWADSSGVLVLETAQPGTGAILRVVGGDASSLLGLSTEEPDSLAFGRDAHLALFKGRERYTFNDLRGSSSFFYRTRFRNQAQNTASAFTQPSFASQPLGVSGASIVSGRLALVGVDGRPLPGVLIRIFNKENSFFVEGCLVSGSAIDGVTGDYGTLEVNLVRGAQVTVAIDGTDIVRDIKVPTDPEVGVFNLLDPDIGPNDYWTVRVPQIDYAPRRSR